MNSKSWCKEEEEKRLFLFSKPDEIVQILPIVVVQWTEAALERGVEDTERERRGGGGLLHHRARRETNFKPLMFEDSI